MFEIKMLVGIDGFSLNHLTYSLKNCYKSENYGLSIRDLQVYYSNSNFTMYLGLHLMVFVCGK